MGNGMLGSRINGGNTEYSRHESDFYPTPPEATTALIDFLIGNNLIKLSDKIWEPACGAGDMVDVFKKYGFYTIATDIIDNEACSFCQDFLGELNSGEFEFDFDWIITNPPFSISADFIKQCFKYGKNFALLVKSQYWHSKTRLPLFEETKPSYILPLTWRPDFCFKKRGKGSPLMDVMWVIWTKDNDYCKYIPIKKPVIK